MPTCSRIAAVALLTAATAASAVAQNRALNMPAFSSGAYSSVSQEPNAVDGNTDGNYSNGSIFHTALSQGGWWYVDLGQSYDVSQIDYWNRTDYFPTRIIGATVGLFTAAPYQMGSPAPVWSATSTTGAIHQVFAPGASGRYVGIIHPGNYLEIAELEVAGTPTAAPPSTVPEPTTWALLGGGLLMLAVGRRRVRIS